ncbi:tetratricopeptide repeat protein [Acidicapsa ligni]|uniref:tetratricopeptide repeat protein n=1 Tax=Acidicapsa ligni TaxID=542300 RepID=UPI0021DFCD4F|nr:hypothetical protein [Acidicapsa ligni]
MKKYYLASVFASVLFAGISLATAPTLLAQAAPASSDQITIKDPAEFSAYQNAITQTDPAAKAAASETFLSTYPQSVVKKSVLDGLIDAYMGAKDLVKAADAAKRMLQLDPNNLRAMYLIVAIDKQLASQAAASDPAKQAQLLDDAAAMSQKGLAATKPADVKDEDFKKQKEATDPVFDSAIAYDDIFSKKDFKAAIEQLRAELEATPVEQTKVVPALNDTLTLGDAYTQLTPPDMVNAVWFLARAQAFAPDNFKPVIDKKAKYWYKRYHGSVDGYDAILAQAATSLFPPADFKIKPADTPADIANNVVATTSDLSTLALGDKEFILANASKENADKVWDTIKDKTSEIPGTVIAATASQLQIAVTDDAKQDKKADFTVNMKTPLADKAIPAVGSDVKGLIGTFDSYTQSPAQIILKDGEIQVEKKPVHKPAAGHRKPTA